MNATAGCKAINVRNAVNTSTIFTVNDAGYTGVSGPLGVTGNTTLSDGEHNLEWNTDCEFDE